MFGFSSSRGRQRGRKWEAHRSNHSMGGEGKGGGEKAALLPAENSRRGRRAAPLSAFSPAPCGPHSQTLARATRAPSTPRPAASGRSLSGHLCSMGPRPTVTPGLGYQARGGLSTRLVGCGRALQLPGRKWGFNSGMSGSCSEGWNCHQNSATVGVQQRMKVYGVSLPVHKNWREFRLVGMVWVWFCQKR